MTVLLNAGVLISKHCLDRSFTIGDKGYNVCPLQYRHSFNTFFVNDFPFIIHTVSHHSPKVCSLPQWQFISWGWIISNFDSGWSLATTMWCFFLNGKWLSVILPPTLISPSEMKSFNDNNGLFSFFLILDYL